MFERVLIANRGEIAVRVIRACRDLGVQTVLAASSIDADTSLAARLADRVVRIGGPRPAESYLNLPAVLETARATGVDALHPGYGFLSEDARLAAGCAELGVAFVGPTADVIERVGDKVSARDVAQRAGVPISDGFALALPLEPSVAQRLEREVGYPLVIKAVHGGGGRGMRLVTSPHQLAENAAAAAAEAAAAFGDPALYVERWFARARHVEVQILGLADGEIRILGDRDCSVQRRHQKLIEEAPAPTLSARLRKELHEASRRIGGQLGYRNAGTVEFVVDAVTEEFAFLEVNARLQVEHPVTEAVSGVDIVRSQLQIAAGEPVDTETAPAGHAIECRINAESPEQNFRPSPGRIQTWRPPVSSCVRIDTHCYGGYTVPPYYDSLLAKVIACGGNRSEAVENMTRALDEFEIGGIATTIDYARSIVASDEFAASEIHTRWVDERAATA